MAISLLVGAAVYAVLAREITNASELNAIAVGQAILNQERSSLIDAGGAPSVRVVPTEAAGLDQRLREYLAPFQMFKIKIYAADKTIVYSTDRKIIGEKDVGNPRLDSVLATGLVDSHIEHKGEIWDLRNEQRFGAEVIETYLPIRAGNSIIGSFEIYIDVTSTHERIIRVVALCVASLLFVLVIVFAVLYLIMRKGAASLREAQIALHELAVTDTLTGTFRRSHLMERVAEVCADNGANPVRRRSSAYRISLLMVDIDHFKKINDTHGHQAGDAVLRELAARLRNSLRPYDVLGRYGGEEFLVLLPGTDFIDARAVAERARAAIESQAFDAAGTAIRVTVSIGVASATGGAETMENFIGRADKALYTAKNAGRNRVMSDEPSLVAVNT